MIKRYSREAMEKVWSEESRFAAWLKVELLTCEGWEKLGVIPKSDLELLQKASYNLDRIKEIEAETKHDVIAFTRAVSETLGAEKKWIHYGLTSTDVVDTANGYLLKQANQILRHDLLNLIQTLKEKAIQYKYTVQMGRTHGIHAEITTFGMKMALWYDEMNRQLERFNQAAKTVEVGKLSGAVGTHANIPIFVEQYVCDQLGLDRAKISTQTLQRDRHAYYLSCLALIATSLEKMATEIRHLQRTEIREVEEYFDPTQKGSSAMPHKRNPISSENISGCARVIRGYMLTAYENVSLWHERDISHSSAERIILPDATILLDYMLNRFNRIISCLVVNEEQMKQNIDLTKGMIFSQHVLLKLVDQGLSRETAYDIVQSCAMKSYQTGQDFKSVLLNNSQILQHLTVEQIEVCFNPVYHLQAIDDIFASLGLNE